MEPEKHIYSNPMIVSRRKARLPEIAILLQIH